MHRLLKRQLKKVGYTEEALTREQLDRLLMFIDQVYKDNDEDRELLENVLSTSSKEMQGLYDKLQNSAESDLAKSEEKYRRLVENLKHHYFFYTHDTEGVFTYLSNSITVMLGYTKDEFLTHYEEYHTDDPMNELAVIHTKNSMKGIQQPPYKVSIYHKNGSVRYIEVTEIPLINEAGDVEGVEGIARDITLEYEAQEKITHLAKHDMLTGVPNRLHLEEELEILISKSKRHEHKFAMLFLDLDHFKQINDTLGHDVGDKLLQKVVERIKPNIRKVDIFARIGGDEFIIILTDIKEEELSVVIQKIMDLMRQTWYIENYELKVSTSMGIAMYPQDGTSIIELMKKADIAMYQAKELGRDNFSFFTEDIDKRVHEEMRLEQDMAEALRENQFELYFQPTLHIDNNQIVGAEALIRWNHPIKGMIYPDKFITLAESTGFILKLGRWIIEESCRMLARFNAVHEKKLILSVNVSARQFQHGDLPEIIKTALERSHIEPSQFAIEITESIMFKNQENVIKKLEDIKSLGVHIYMDDFGTGYSSLSYLNCLPIDTLKIDKIFVDEITQDGRKAVLLDTIIAMGKSLDITVIAEGVEHEYQRKYLTEHGCSLYQGYLFAKPLCEDDYSALVSKLEESDLSMLSS